MKRVLLLFVLVLPLFVSAEIELEGSPSPTPPEEAVFLDAVDRFYTHQSPFFKSVMSGAVAPLLGVLFAGLALWGVSWVFQMLKRGFSKSCESGESDYWNGYDEEADAKDRAARDAGFLK